MAASHFAWSPLETDALMETVNVGVGRAAGALHEMTGSEILLSVPELRVAELATLARALNAEIDGDAVLIRQEFEGRVAGAATLIFTEPSSRKLVGILLQDVVDGAASPELEAEAHAELGNIVINSCLGALSDAVVGELKVDLPIVFKGCASKALRDAEQEALWDAFLVRVSLTSKPAGIGGLILFTLQSGHLSVLRGLLNDYVRAALPA